jgi:hypothetical protein
VRRSLGAAARAAALSAAVAAALAAPARRTAAQPPAAAAAAAADSAAAPGRAPRRPAHAPLFADEAPLELTLAADLGRLRRDLSEKAPWRPGTLTYADPDGRPRAVPVGLRTRGVWRLKHCQFPPLRLNFAGAAARGTVFEGLDKPKMVNYCRDAASYEQLVLQELQLYRAFALLTPASHRARLARVTYVDAAKQGRPLTTRYAILLEEPKSVAARVGGRTLDAKGARAGDLEPYQAVLAGVFQYMVGNHDWSTAGRHNAELMHDSAGAVLLVPYDFDFTGAVNAPYATVDPKLRINRVRDRLYRGHCAPAADYERAFARFRERKDAIYALWADPVGRLVEPGRARETLAYFDEFYATINSPRDARRDILDACVDAQ